MFYQQNEAHILKRPSPSPDRRTDARQNQSDARESKQHTPAPEREHQNDRHNDMRPEKTASQAGASCGIGAAVHAGQCKHAQEHQQNRVLALQQAVHEREEG